MAMAECPSSPKRVKVSAFSSNSMAFALSPLGLSKAEAIAVKSRDPAHTQLRAISVAPLTTKEAQEEHAEGYTVCLAPYDTQSNKWYSDLKNRYHLYVDLLGSSPKVCEVDLVVFVLKHLDYFLKQVVAESLVEKSQEFEEFEEVLLGPHKAKPFQSFSGNNLRYSVLLLFVDRMKAKVMDADGASRLDFYESLLLTCENKLMDSLEACGVVYVEGEKIKLVQVIREELTDFLLGEMKGDRDIASHVFCDLLWVDTKSPLHEHDLASPHFPGVRDAAFDLSRPSRVETMAVKALILKDLQMKFDSKQIGKFTHEVTKAAFKLVHSCIQRNVGVCQKVVCGDMHAVIPGLREGSESDVVSLDPPSRMSQLQNMEIANGDHTRIIIIIIIARARFHSRIPADKRFISASRRELQRKETWATLSGFYSNQKILQ